MTTSYTDIDLAGVVATMTAVDSGTATPPAVRPSVFTPPVGYVAVTSAVDSGISTTPAVRPEVFEPPSVVITLDPGLQASG